MKRFIAPNLATKMQYVDTKNVLVYEIGRNLFRHQLIKKPELYMIEKLNNHRNNTKIRTRVDQCV